MSKEMNTEEAVESFTKNQDIKSAIKITEASLKGCIFVGGRRNIVKNAIKCIIADLTRQLEINKEHKKLNGELREEINKLEKENKKITEARNWLSEHILAQIATPELLDRILQDKYISKDVIKKKIEELKYRSYSKLETDAMQQVLEELL